VAVLYRCVPDPDATGRYVIFHYCSREQKFNLQNKGKTVLDFFANMSIK
jgi:hypothetical protein